MEDQRTYYRDKEGSHTLDEQRPEQTLEWARNSHCIPLGQKNLGTCLDTWGVVATFMKVNLIVTILAG